MARYLQKIIDFGYKVSDGNNQGFACFLSNLRISKAHEERWKDLVVEVIAELPIEKSKEVLRSILRDS